MKALVVGGSGFLGSHVADALTAANFDVTIFDLKPSPFLLPQQKMHIGSILDADALNEAIRGCDYVYDFAGIADLDDASTKPTVTIKMNIEGTVNILEACMHARVKRFIYASTIYVYSNKGGFYRCSKQAAELYIEEYHNRYDFDYTVLRYGTLYGPRSDKRNSIYRYLSQALTDKKLIIAGDGEELREYIHVRDAAKLSVRILGDEYRNSHIVLTGHHPIKLNQLILTICEILNNNIDIEYKPGKNPDHYSITPYSFIPKIGQKLTTDCYTDLGQGLLECLHDYYLEREV